ncbi:MAG TPA: DUF6519 domain-containing protein [Candidatus Angelobacter sp.]|nr:DUF6519 domain-containing protein [Candidatus Angelobacter sp.]
MKADLSRNTFNPFKHFTRVLMQQGRVQLDADLNEQAAILLHYLRSLAADLIGPAGGPQGDAFAISPLSIPNTTNDFRIGLGHYYVNGILCEASSAPIKIFLLSSSANGIVQVDGWSLDGIELQDAAYSPQLGSAYLELFDDSPAQAAGFPVLVKITNFDKAHNQITIANLPSIPATANPKLRRIITYLHQPGFVYSSQNTPVPPPLVGPAVQVYLDTWERLVTCAEDDSIREVALGGPDTAARAQLVWQVKTTPADNNTCMTLQGLHNMFQWENRGKLKAMAKQNTPSTDPCIISPSSRFSGLENQLYRVEINRGGTAWDGTAANKPAALASGATFKWSRENGCVFFPIASGGGTNTLVLESLGRDDRFSLEEGDWVEVQDDRSVLSNITGTLLQVQSIDRSSLTVILKGTPDPSVGKDLSLHPLLRRWDHQAGDPAEGGLTLGSDNAALIVENASGTWLTLEDGVQVQFQLANPFTLPVIPPPNPPSNMNVYRPGDYWLVPARTATGDVEWPKLTDANGNPETDANGNIIPLALSPQGVTHHYAPLAVLSVSANGITSSSDCRSPFQTTVETERKQNAAKSS